ncbi:MAG: hypothetical protein AB8E87_12020 [Prochlorococcus sp.]
MLNLLMAGLTSGLAALSSTQLEAPFPQRFLPTQNSRTVLVSGLGEGYCWARYPYPNGPVTKLTNACGGGGEGAKDVSCSPFTYRPFQKNLDSNLNAGCSDGQPYDEIVTGAKWGLGARTWASFPNRTDYWVFHNCDGAGIQPDCLGDIKYIERFDGGPGQPRCEKGSHGRNHCTFTHPNSKTTFGLMKYWAGWYNSGNDLETGNLCGAGANKDRAWNQGVCNKIESINNGINPYNNVDGALHTFSFALFPWVCEADPSMPNANFSSPSMDSYGVRNGWKCYADNEPGPKLSNGENGWPPYIELYFAGLFEESPGKYVIRLDKWMINNSDTPELVGKGFAIYPCNSEDNCEW